MSLSGSSKRRRMIMERRARRSIAAASREQEASVRAPIAMRAPDAEEAWIDLIHHEPKVTVDIELLRHAVRFAFESGDAGGLLGRAVDDAPTTGSSWDPSVFASSLFLPELLSACFAIEIDKRRYEPSEAHLVRLLTHPTRDPRDVALRQHVLRELAAQPKLRRAIEQAYAALRNLRALLDERPMSPGETARRKIEVLTAIKTFLDESDEGLADARSALSRLHAFAREVRESDVYRRLSQLLEFDKDMARIEVRIVLGSDGKIRDFGMIRASENVDNPLVWSPWRRLWSRFFAWFRGYRYGENEVLLKVIDQVFSDLENAILPCFGLIGDLELYLAALGFKDTAEKHGLAVCLPELTPTPQPGEVSAFEVRSVFNPLLLLQDIVPTPCDIATRERDALVLITGPNSGGKTRLLQALALTQLLAQNGLFVPAKSAKLTSAPTMFVSLVEGAPADQKEGRLGTELVRVRQLFEQLEPGTFVVLDELCSGTNPSEGIAIFEMVISLLPRLHPQVFVTTHFLDAARKLDAERPVERLSFLQVELDANEQPTYQFVPGVAPTSLAHQVASRLGVTREELEALVARREAELFEDVEDEEPEPAAIAAR